MSAADALGVGAGDGAGGSEEGAAVGGVEGEGRRRRRRRRRGRGRGERGEGGGIGGMETLDAAEMLARGDSGAEGAPSASEGAPAAMPRTSSNGASSAPAVVDNPNDGLKRLRVNIGFDDGFKGRGAVAKKIASLAGLNEGIVHEVEARRDHAVLKATPDIAELVVERVDGATIGKKVVSIGPVAS